MADPDLLDVFRGLTRAEVAALVGQLPLDVVQATAEALPRASHDRDLAAGGPAGLALALDRGYRRPPHVALLSDAIEQTVLEAMNGTGPGRLIVSMPPRVGKSYTASLWTPAWYLERFPDRNVILASHDGNYSVSWGRKVRDLLRRHGDQLQVRIARDSAAAGEWETTLGGGMLSRGIAGSITGRGGHLLLIDDPIKDFAAAHSAAIRQAHWEWWLSTAQTRLEPGAAVVLVMTRWHDDDLAGRLTSNEHEGDPDEWTVLRIPALGEGKVDDVEAGKLAPDALERQAGEPLRLASTDETEEQARARWAKIRTGVGPYIFAGLYQQRPSEPEGTILKRAWWHYYRRVGDEIVRPDGTVVAMSRLRIVQSWDLTFKDNTSSDWVVGQVWGALGAGPRFLLAQYRDRADYPTTKAAMRAMREDWPSTEATFVEDKANGPAIIADLRDEISGLVPVNPKGDKVQRAYGVTGDLEAGSIWLPVPDEAGFDVRGLVQECAEFPNGTHDDQVDALTQAILRLRAGGTTVSKPTGSKGDASARSRLTSQRISR
ncbi:MAG: phage terminase large subunit [Dermatophilaceae bacterium]